MVSDIVTFVVVIGGLIVGHELGHFLAARLSGIHVEEFGLGYPPRHRRGFARWFFLPDL
jgi:regulator of sigma E protease